MNHLIRALKVQTSVKFNGNIILQNASNSQFLGKVSLKDGEILVTTPPSNSIEGKGGAPLHKMSEYRALRALVVLSEEQQSDVIVEPEIIVGKCVFSCQASEIIKRLEADVSYYRKIRGLRPPNHLKLMIKKGRIIVKESSSDKAKLLRVILDYSLVKDIYKNSDLPDFEVTMGLVELREKGVIKVMT